MQLHLCGFARSYCDQQSSAQMLERCHEGEDNTEGVVRQKNSSKVSRIFK